MPKIVHRINQKKKCKTEKIFFCNFVDIKLNLMKDDIVIASYLREGRNTFTKYNYYSLARLNALFVN